MGYFIYCYNEQKEMGSYEVSKPIFIYIRQLENEINYSFGGIQRLYPFRFPSTEEVNNLVEEENKKST